MATTPTQLPVPSEKPQDLKFNAGKIDEFVTSMGWTYTDRFGNKHYTIEGINYLAQQVMNAFGYVTLTGADFDTGATVSTPNEVLFNPADNSYYKWSGSFALGAKDVPANSTPESTGGIGPGKWLSVGDTVLRNELLSSGGVYLVNGATRSFNTALLMASSTNLVVDTIVITGGYHSLDDGGACTYTIKSGAIPADNSEAGSIQIGMLYAKPMAIQGSLSLRQLGAIPFDNSKFNENDLALSDAAKRSKAGFCQIIIDGVFYHKKPVYLEYYQDWRGVASSGDHGFTPGLYKIDNTICDKPDMPFHDSGFSDTYAVDAGIVIGRQTADTDSSQGVKLSGFELKSMAKSKYAIYVPRAGNCDFDVNVQGYHCTIRSMDFYTSTLTGTHLGLGSEATSPADSNAYHFEPDPSFGTPGGGSTITIHTGVAYGFMKGLVTVGAQVKLINFAFDHIAPVGAADAIVIQQKDSYISGQISVESCHATLADVNGGSCNLEATATYNNDAMAGKPYISTYNTGRLKIQASTISPNTIGTGIEGGDSSRIEVDSLSYLGNLYITHSNPNNVIDKFKLKAVSAKTSDAGLTYSAFKPVQFSTASGDITSFNKVTGTYTAPTTGVVTINLNAPIQSGSIAIAIDGALLYETKPFDVGKNAVFTEVITIVVGSTLTIKSGGSGVTLGNADIGISITPAN